MKTARKPRPAFRAPNRTADADLRRWCIEQAIRWPMEGSFGAQAVYTHGGGRIEADVISRAERIRKWVTAAA